MSNKQDKLIKIGFKDGKQERDKEVLEIIDKMGESRCGYMDSIEGCNRIDREELKQALKQKHIHYRVLPCKVNSFKSISWNNAGITDEERASSNLDILIK